MRHKMIRTLALALACLAAPAFADEPPAKQKADLEAFMHAYLKAWNAHDAKTITSTYYRLEGDNPWSTEAGLKAEFDRLVAQGYTVSDIKGVTGCVLGPDTGQVELRYIRLTKDGGFMPPKDRASIYKLKKFADGWRVIGFAGLAADKKMECPAKAG